MSNARATFGKDGQSIFVGVEMKQANRRRKSIPTASVLAARIRDEGATAASLAEEFAVSKSKVARALNDAGFRGNGEPTFHSRRVSMADARLPRVSHTYVADDYRLSGGACVGEDPEIFYPSTVRERAVNGPLAKSICNGDDTRPVCPVRDACRARALEEEATDGLRWGIRGGLDETERAALAESGAA